MHVDIDGIDHVHIEVLDRAKSSEWYKRVLGLVCDEYHAAWAASPGGPLVLSTAAGRPVLSLFARACKPRSRDSTIAFRVSGKTLLAFLDGLEDLQIRHRSGVVLSRANLIDHDLSWSIYFPDPDDNPIEITSYDHDIVAKGC